MGFIKEIYSDNRGGLAVAFRGEKNTANYVNTDSIQEALEYFNMYVKNNQIYIKTIDNIAIQELGIEAEQAVVLRNSIDNVIHLLDDETAVRNTILFPVWAENVEYFINDRIKYNNVLYKVLQEHISQKGWEPDVAVSLFARMLTDEEKNQPLDWVQPDSTNGYSEGDLVIYNEEYYKSTADNNVTIPGTVGSLWIKTDAEGNKLPTDFASGLSYMIGDQIIFEGEVYESLIDNNVWSPADYPAGWSKIEE